MGELQHRSKKVIHYFNPGHETAVLNNSPHYQPAANQVKMQHDLCFLPAWYACQGDYVLAGKLPDDKEFLQSFPVNTLAKAITPPDMKEINGPLEASFWGISPQAAHLFNQYKKDYELDSLLVPEWKEAYRELCSRRPAQECLSFLINTIPEIERDILPVYHHNIETIEALAGQSGRMLLAKSPYSSSGRGLSWLPPGGLARSERQIIAGILKKQGQVSVELALDKVLDFSMHFDIKSDGAVAFLGYSLFKTSKKGAYELSLLDSQHNFAQTICFYIDKELLDKVRTSLPLFLQKKYGGIYTGNIGVDMLVYREGEGSYKLNPCIEINMRKSMGYLSLVLYNKFIAGESRGAFHIDYHKNSGLLSGKHKYLAKSNPPVIKDMRMRSGYMSLCPIGKDTNYHAYILINKI